MIITNEYEEQEKRDLAHKLWERAGKPEGMSDTFWFAAEARIKRETVYENLKLPICPKCHDTHFVHKMNVCTLLYVHVVFPWFTCTECGIKWHAKEGIREPDDVRPCFG